MNTSTQSIGRRPLLHGGLGLVLGALVGFTEVSVAAPFAACPAQAFLTQSRPALLYGVDLTTGIFASPGDPGTPDKLNAMGFSIHDSYLYSWHYADQTLARIHADYRIESPALNPSLPMDYFVGDVALVENAYCMYRRSTRYGGLWRIALDPADADYLSPMQVADASTLQLKIFDLAFHSNDGYAYSVDSRGRLWRIDVSHGRSTHLGDVGQSGAFGAVYFDDTVTLYISRNKDGKIFSIGVHGAAPTAELFSYGPASGNNDGARHAVDPSLYLGSRVDAENRAFPAPAESDDRQDGSDDEDGIQFPTAFSPGESAIIEASVAGAGYLNIWLDYKRDGRFSEAEGNTVAPGDGLEIHLKNQPPTWRADLDMRDRADERSVRPRSGAERVTYQNDQGLPWAIEIGGRWCYPSEYQDLNTAIANEWDELSEAALGERLAHRLLSVPKGEQDYARLLSLDLHNNPEHLAQLARPALLADAEAQIASNGAPGIGELIATAAGLQTRELFASGSFLFSSSRELTIDVDISARRTAPTFLSVCGDFTRRAGTYRVNYADCQFKTPLQKGRYTGVLRTAGGLEQILVTLMPLEDPSALRYIEWSLPERGVADREAVLRVR